MNLSFCNVSSYTSHCNRDCSADGLKQPYSRFEKNTSACSNTYSPSLPPLIMLSHIHPVSRNMPSSLCILNLSRGREGEREREREKIVTIQN